MNPIEKNIIKLMRATLGEVAFTDSVEDRISQRFNAKRQLVAMQAFSEQLPLFPEMDLLEKLRSNIEAELEVSNFLWNFLLPFFIGWGLFFFYYILGRIEKSKSTSGDSY